MTSGRLPGPCTLSHVNAVVRVLLALPLAAALAALAALAAGCAGTPSVGDCPALDLESPVTLTKQDRSYRHSVFCEWSVGETTKVRAHYYQPTRYDAQTRADTATENAWRRDDEFNVTHRVEGLGDGGYRYTSIVDDVVTVTVKGFRGFRQLTVDVSQPYTTEKGVAAQEGTAESLAKSLLEAS